jgi:hypothetical protein
MTKFMVKTAIISCVAVVIASCGSKSSDKTLENSKGLLAITSQVENGDTLIGVRTIFDTIQVVPFAAWDSIKAVSPEVVCAYKAGSMYAYTAKGQQMGKGALSELLTITTSSADSTTFYRGVEAENQSVFYFPAANAVIDGVSDMYIGRTVGLFETSNGWDVRNYGGSLLWQVGNKDCCILRRIYAKEETIQIALLSHKGAEIYDTKGELVREVPMAEWKKATRSFRREAKIGSANYGELDVNYQF